MNIRKLELDLIDYVCFFTVIATLAFHDKTILLVAAQLLFVFATVFNQINNYVLVLPKGSKKYIVWYLVFFSFAAISALWSTNRTTWISILMSIIQVAMLGICIIIYESSEKKINYLMWAIMIASLILCLRMAVQVPVDAWGSERVGKYIGYGNVGVTYVLGYSSIIPFFYARLKKNPFYYLLMLLFIGVSSLTGTKKGLIVFMIGIMIIMFLEAPNPKKLTRNLLIFLLICIVGIFVILNVDILYEAIGKRFLSSFGQLQGNTLDKSTRDRAFLSEYAWQTFLQSPLIGIGVDAFRFYELNPIKLYAHNNYLELLSTLGVLGTGIYYSMPAFTTIKLGRSVKRGKLTFSVLSVAILISLLIGDVVSVSYVQETLQLYLAMIFGISRYIMYREGEIINENLYSNSI